MAKIRFQVLIWISLTSILKYCKVWLFVDFVYKQQSSNHLTVGDDKNFILLLISPSIIQEDKNIV